MAIERTTTNIGLSILERGTPGWGVLTNQNMDFIDQAFGLDRARITSLENETSALPLAIAARVGHNQIDNNIFSRPVTSDPAQAVGWTSVFANGAIGYTTRDTSTYLIGRGGSQSAASMRISITNVNLGSQIRPFPGLNILDPVTKTAIATNDARQLTNAFGYVFQPVILSAKTKYTLSCYGKPEIPTSSPPINVHWKIGVVFKNGSNILHSYFTEPQINYTSDINTSSFRRTELTFETPDLPVVQAEVWLISAGNAAGSIGSCYFDGVQLEQATRATALEAFSVRNGDLSVAGDLIVGGSLKLQQDQLVLATNKVVFSGNVQIGDDITEDILDVFTKISTFYGPVKILGDTIIGDSPIDDQVSITASKTTFFNNQDSLSPQGGDVEVQGSLVVKGNTVLGDSNSDTVTINASLITAINDLDIGGDVDIAGSLTVSRAVTLGTNQPADKLTVNMGGLGVDINGDVYMDDDLTVAHSVEIGTAGTCSSPSPDSFVVHAGSSTFDGSVVIGKGLTVGGTGAPCSGGPIELHTDGNDFELTSKDVNVFAGTGNTTWQTLGFDISGSLEVGTLGTPSQNFHAHVSDIVLGDSTLVNTMAVYAATSSFFGNTVVNGDSTITGDLTVEGGPILFSTGLVPSHTFASFVPSVITSTATPYVGQSALGGTITLGDSTALVLDGYGRRKYGATVNVFAGKTNFGTSGLGPGQENVGDVEIGGDLQVHGSTILGNDTTSDRVEIKAYQVLINSAAPGDGYTNATIQIGGGFQNVSWTPTEYSNGALSGNRGGISLNNNGDLWMDGKLTVKGPIDPIELIVTPLTDPVQTNAIVVKPGNASETFKVTKQGDIWAEGTLSLNDGYTAYLSDTTATLARSAAPLTDFSVWATNTNLSGNLTVNNALSVDQLQTNDIDVINDVTVGGDATVVGDFTTYGTQATVGNGTVGSRFDVLVDDVVIGVDGYDRGDVIIGNDLTVRHSITLGSGTPDTANLTFDVINFFVDSDRVLLAPQDIVSGANVLELKGFRIGGGFQNNVYNNSDLDHGGVTIDAYGNIYADGSMFVNGELGFNRLTLTAPLGTDLCEPFLIATNKVLNDDVFLLDNLGNVEADGYYFIHDKYADGYTCDQPASQTYPNTSFAMFRVINDANTNTVFEVDNAGNVVLDGYLTTEIPGGSTLATASVTVGTGLESLGDFNIAGHNNASADPIGAALSYLSGLGSPGKLFIKKGTYTVPGTGWTVPANVTVEGEGAQTLLSASIGTIFTLNSNTALSKFRTTGGSVGAAVAAGATDVSITDISMTATAALQVAVGASRVNVNAIVASATNGTIALDLNGSATITNSTFAGYALGGQFLGSDIVVSQCTVDAQGAAAPTLVFDIQGANNRVVNCDLLSYPTGLTISSAATETVLVDNTIIAALISTGDGLSILGDRSVIRGNRLRGFGDIGIDINADRVSVSGNYLTYPGDTMSAAIQVTGTENIVAGNFIADTEQGVVVSGTRHSVLDNNIKGAYLGSPGILVAGSDHIVRANIVEGFVLQALVLSASASQIVDNKLIGADVGISCVAGGHQITGNCLSSYIQTGISILGSACVVSHNRTLGGGTAQTGITITGDENVVNSNYVVDHTTNGITITGNDNIAVGNVTLRNP